MISSLLKNIATLGFIGYFPVAPGTVGTLAALIFFFLLRPSPAVQVLLFIALVVIGTIASARAGTILKEKDSRHIVIDEFTGYVLSMLSLPATIPYLAAGFLLFRFFDILKPPPIGWMERVLPGGVGVMSDDLMAGVYTNVLLRLWILLALNW
ncbi:MAG: phosphatidylglycerophosphatase A [Nitrospirae bacterium]|nr:phosphatidylglycerophosphatase A [Nitrospirota bacterium]